MKSRNKKVQYKKLEPVYLEWLDSRSNGNFWESTNSTESLEPALCKTYGFIIESKPNFLTIASTISQEQFLCRLTIPAQAITKIIKLC